MMDGIVRGGHLEDRVQWFRNLVAEEGLTVDPTSFAGVALPAMERLAREHFAGPGLSSTEQLELLGRFNSFNQLLVMIQGAWPVAEKQLRPRLPELIKGPFELSSTGTNTEVRNVAFETFVGCLASRLDPNFDFEEPDVRFRFRGVHWGVACKIAYSDNPSRTVDQIIKGAKQIEEADCDFGMVVVNVTPQIPHHKWQFVDGERVAVFANAEDAQETLRSEIVPWVESIPTEARDHRATEDKDGRPRNRVRCLLFVALSHGYVQVRERAAVLVPLTAVYPDRLSRKLEGPEGDVVPVLFEQRNELVRAARLITV